MPIEIEAPAHLIDVNGLDLAKIEPTPDGGLRIGALVRNTDLAADARVRRDYPVIQGIVLMFSFVYVLVNLAVDLVYTLIDPRIRY